MLIDGKLIYQASQYLFVLKSSMNGLTVKTSLSSLKGILDSQQEPKILILQHGTMHQTNTLERLQKEFMASRSILQQKPTTAF